MSAAAPASAPQRLRVCLVADAFPRLSETFVLHQASGLAARGHEVGVLATTLDRDRAAAVPGLGPRRARWGRLAALSAHAERLPPRLRHLARRTLDRLDAGFLRRFDVIVAHFGYEGLRIAELGARTGGLPPLVTIYHGHDVATVAHDRAMGLYAPLFRSGTLHLPVNGAFRETLIAGGAPPARTRVHRMGVPTADMPFTDRAPGGSRSILSVCRLTAKKGIGDALRALAELASRRPDLDWSYRIAGDGELRADLEALTRNLGLEARVEFLGARPHAEIGRLMQESDLFLLPSVTAPNGDAEGVPVSLMEAMASGALVVSTLHSGIPELIEDGVSGFLAPEGDPPALAVALERAASAQDRPSIARAARRRVEREFDRERLLDELELLLATAARGTRSAAAAPRSTRAERDAPATPGTGHSTP